LLQVLQFTFGVVRFQLHASRRDTFSFGMTSVFSSYAAARYAKVKMTNPHLQGRRAVQLKIAQEFWDEVQASATPGMSGLTLPIGNGTEIEPDPLDFEDAANGIVSQRGVVIRTDFSNDVQWLAFMKSLLTAEQEGMEELVAATEDPQSKQGGAEGEQEEEESSSDEEEGEEESADVDMEASGTNSNSAAESQSESFIVIDPTAYHSPQFAPLAPILNNATNLTLLRLFTDVDIIPSLTVPMGSKKLKGASRLIDSHNLCEVYNGRLIWVYDAKSNVDGCVRVVNSRPDSYGTATGDSWRARASFIWELQLNISANTMQISFGGEDRYDGTERKRNVEQAVMHM